VRTRARLRQPARRLRVPFAGLLLRPLGLRPSLLEPPLGRLLLVGAHLLGVRLGRAPRLLDVLLSLSGRLSHLPVDHGALLRIDVLESLLLLLLERVGALDQSMRLLGGADSLLLRLACGLGA